MPRVTAVGSRAKEKANWPLGALPTFSIFLLSLSSFNSSRECVKNLDCSFLVSHITSIIRNHDFLSYPKLFMCRGLQFSLLLPLLLKTCLASYLFSFSSLSFLVRFLHFLHSASICPTSPLPIRQMRTIRPALRHKETRHQQDSFKDGKSGAEGRRKE